jgi:hypothetical protein
MQKFRREANSFAVSMEKRAARGKWPGDGAARIWIRWGGRSPGAAPNRGQFAETA